MKIGARASDGGASIFRTEIGGWDVTVHSAAPDGDGEVRLTAIAEDGGWQVAVAVVWDGATVEQVAMELEATYEASRFGMF
jgi:hypothetical protein